MARTTVQAAVAQTGAPSVTGIVLRDRDGNTITIGANDRFICYAAVMNYDFASGAGRIRLFVGDDDTATADEIVFSMSSATLGNAASFLGQFEGARGKTPRFEVELTTSNAGCNVTGVVVTP